MLGPRHINLQGQVSSRPLVLYDRWLILSVMCLLALGLLMVASTSIAIAERFGHKPFYYLFRQIFFLGLGVALSIWVLRVESRVWQKFSPFLLLGSVGLLLVVLIPGIGRVVNGSMRWIFIGPIGLQISEIAKFCFVIYMASYLVRHQEKVRYQLIGFIRPLIVLGVVAGLLLKEPDFGAAVVILLTAMGMLFLAGVRMSYFVVLFSAAIAAVAFLAISSPYRLQRLTTFLNPWDKQFDAGYQLTQSLIAFGRGGWFGSGLGESIQKLFYLPEAHTDFLFAVLVEELGLLGGVVVIALFAILVTRIFLIGRRAQMNGLYFSGFVAFGFGLWFAIQVLINIGVNVGILPTKGLTLPFMSYGGSSLLMNCVAIAMLLRIDFEMRWGMMGMR